MQKTYDGIDQDQYGGMSAMGAITKDAWLFGILPETETCAGWDGNRIQILYDKTQVEWDKYGCLVSNLPAELRERLARSMPQRLSVPRPGIGTRNVLE